MENKKSGNLYGDIYYGKWLKMCNKVSFSVLTFQLLEIQFIVPHYIPHIIGFLMNDKICFKYISAFVFLYHSCIIVINSSQRYESMVLVRECKKII